MDEETTIGVWVVLWEDLKSLDIDNGVLVDTSVLETDNNGVLVGSPVEDIAGLDLKR